MAGVEGGLPTGTVTFMFTDLEGSTRLWEQHAEEMKDVLLATTGLPTEAVDARGGQVIKGTGDGLQTVFASAVAAAAALASRRPAQR